MLKPTYIRGLLLLYYEMIVNPKFLIVTDNNKNSPFTIMIKIAFQKGGLAFGGIMANEYQRSVQYHQYTIVTCRMNTKEMPNKVEYLLSPCRQ